MPTDPLEPGPIPRIRVRIESLSDLVFGLALSFGSLILIGNLPQNGSDLLVNIFTFGFSFLIVVVIWVGYTRTIAVLPTEVSSALVLNLGLLFCVALEPYLFYLLISPKLLPWVEDPASIAYALDVGLMFSFLAGLAYVVVTQQRAREEDKRLHPLVLKRFDRVVKIQAIIAIIYFASALPIFWNDTPTGKLRFYLWSSSFLMATAFRRNKRENRT